MKKAMLAILISSIIVTISGCATMTIEGDGDKMPNSKNGTHTVHGSFYGFNWSKPDEDKCDNGQSLYRARYHTNLGYVIVPLVSLGLYVPQTVQWWCNGVRGESDEKEYHP